MARRYAGVRRSERQIEAKRAQAARLACALPQGAEVWEVAPGSGSFAIEVARLPVPRSALAAL